MSSYDIRKDPKFLARIKKIESNSNIRVLKDPIEVQLSNNLEAIVVAIGINGSYLVVIPGIKVDGTHMMGEHMFAVWWTDKKSPAFDHTEISKWMSMWIITSDESDFTSIPHRDVDHLKLAISAIFAKRGAEYFDTNKPTITFSDQGITRQIKHWTEVRR